MKMKMKYQYWSKAWFTLMGSRKIICYWSQKFFNSQLPLIQHGQRRKWCLQIFFIAVGTSLPSCYLATTGGIHRQTHRCMRPMILLLLHVFFAAGTCLWDHCLAMIGGIYEVCHWDRFRCRDIRTRFHKDWFRHSKVMGGIHIHTDSMEITWAYYHFLKIREIG
jgi:hypothetical protein